MPNYDPITLSLRSQDLTGRIFGRLKVLSFARYIFVHSQHVACWECQCTCGTLKVCKADTLLKGTIKSCGCLRREMHTKNLLAQTFGKLHVIDFAGYLPKDSIHPRAYWLCICLCGTSKIYKATHLLSGTTQSCGCLRREMNIQRNLVKP